MAEIFLKFEGTFFGKCLISVILEVLPASSQTIADCPRPQTPPLYGTDLRKIVAARQRIGAERHDPSYYL